MRIYQIVRAAARAAARMLVVLGGLTAMTVSQADRTVRVDSRGGAPRLLVDGKPVRARMFFGGPGGQPISIGPEGGRITFEFVAQGDSSGAGTMHFRFGQSPGDIYLDNVQVTDVAANNQVVPKRDFESGPGAFAADWLYFPPEPGNTVGKAAVEAGHRRGRHRRAARSSDRAAQWPVA